MPSLMASLGLDKSQFSSGLRGAKGEAETMGSQIGGALASRIGAALSVAGISMAFNSILQKVADIKSEAIQTGFDTDQIQKFNFALGQMNIEIKSGQTGLGKMNELIGQAAEGEEKAVKTFARWGISTTGKNNSEIFEEIRQSISATSDPAQRVAMAMEIFGRGGRELLPYLTASREELDKMADHAPIISSQDIKNIDEAKRGLDSLKDRLIVIGSRAVSGWMYALKGLAALGGGAEAADAFTSANSASGLAITPQERAAIDAAQRRAGGPKFRGTATSFGGAWLNPKPSNLISGGIMGGSIWAAIAAAIIKPEPKKESPGEVHQINKMLDLNSMQKIGAYAATPPGYEQMVKASIEAEKLLRSIDKKTPAHAMPVKY